MNLFCIPSNMVGGWSGTEGKRKRKKKGRGREKGKGEESPGSPAAAGRSETVRFDRRDRRAGERKKEKEERKKKRKKGEEGIGRKKQEEKSAELALFRSCLEFGEHLARGRWK